MEFKSLEELASLYGAKENEHVVFDSNVIVKLINDGITVSWVNYINEISFERDAAVGFCLYMYNNNHYRAMYYVPEHFSVEIS